MNTPLEQAAPPCSTQVTPGNPVEFAELPLGAIHNVPESEVPFAKFLWVKISPKTSAALLPEEVVTAKQITANVPKRLIVQRYWIGVPTNE